MRTILDLWWDNTDGQEQLKAWMKTRAIDLVEETVSEEMDALTKKLRFRLQDATPEHLLQFRLDTHIEPVIKVNSPTIFRIVRRALQTDRAVRKNKHKSPDQVRP